MRRLAILAGSALVALATAGCTDRHGRIDPARSTLLGVGAGAAAFGLGSAILRDQQYRGSSGGRGFASHRGYSGPYLPPVAQPYVYGGGGHSRGYGW